MTKKQVLSILLTVVVGGAWLYANRDWFASDRIQIHTRVVPAGLGGGRFSAPASGAQPGPVMFEWERKLKLKTVRVVPVAAIETNKYAHEIWHLVSDSNSVPTRGFIYGMFVPGMRPAVKDIDPEPLVPGEKYRLFLQAGSVKIEHDFVAPSSDEP